MRNQLLGKMLLRKYKNKPCLAKNGSIHFMVIICLLVIAKNFLNTLL